MNIHGDILNLVQNGDIASLYMLEQRAHNELNESELGGFYTNILDLALERLTDTLEAHRVMDINEVQDFATLRALYEYAMEHYSVGKISDAGALLEVLSGISNGAEFSHAMKAHVAATSQNISLDDFLQSIADIDKTQEAGSFYISHFKNNG
jgi:hypothetical protein